jgi:hypothetical protein
MNAGISVPGVLDALQAFGKAGARGGPAEGDDPNRPAACQFPAARAR